VKGYQRFFHQQIEKTFPDKATRLIKEIDLAFKQIEPDIRFGSQSRNPVDRRMEFSGYFLAAIKVLDKEGETLAKIREVMISIAEEYVRPKNKLQAFLKKLPVLLMGTPLMKPLLNQFSKRVSVRAHPDGFVVNVLTDKKETLGFGYGIDILECGICKLFNKHQSAKYTSILCEVDHITTSLAGLKMIRTGTIALGANKCDFRYTKK
jgi:hypothetical protein